jgi:MFS family permease
MKTSHFPFFALAVFLSGASVMTLELLGSRLITPIIGATINVWTALISVFLVGISVGYAFGDKMADKNISRKTLGLLFITAGLFVSIVSPLNVVLNDYFSETTIPFWVLSLLYTTTLLFFPAALLGSITVYTLRIALRENSSVGKTNGTLYALSTLGSLAGILGTGFYLVPFFTVSNILFFLSCVLILFGSIALLHGWYVDKTID